MGCPGTQIFIRNMKFEMFIMCGTGLMSKKRISSKTQAGVCVYVTILKISEILRDGIFEMPLREKKTL